MIPQLYELFTLCLCALPLWALLRGLWLMIRKPRPHPLREAIIALFAVFMFGILYMALDGKWATPQDMLRNALDRLPFLTKIHLRPFHTILMHLSNF